MGNFLYQEAKEKILALIEEGIFKPNQKFMTERELAEKLGYNRMTIKKAMNALVEDGVLEKRRGAGTFLTEYGHSSRFNIGDKSPISLTQGIRTKGMTSSSFVESFQLIYYTPKLMEIFPEYYEFFELIRIREADGKPVSIQYAYFPFRLFKDAHRYNFSQFSLYDYMEYKNKRPVKFKKKLAAFRVEDEELFSKINARAGEYILRFEYYGYTAHDELVEYTEAFFDPNQINFTTEIERELVL
jgi:GntR family transcriptional regulator